MRYRYLIVGGGMAADGACRGIRDVDPDGRIGIVAAERHPPYARPPLSKALWKGEAEDSVWLGTEGLGVEVLTDRTIVSVDLKAKRAMDDGGGEHDFERLLLATGAAPRHLPDDTGTVIYFRTLDDYRRVRELAAEDAELVVVGGGFIGSELAAALTMAGCHVTMVFPEGGIGGRLFPADLTIFLNDFYRAKGVDVRPSQRVEQVRESAGSARVQLASGQVLEASAVIAGLGVVPNDQLAVVMGLPTDDGVLVDERGRVQGCSDVFAAGDVARFPASALGTSLRVEHEDHARSHGRRVGANMAGADEAYDHLPFFYSDLFELGYEAIGEVDPRLPIEEHWAEPGRKGVVAYLSEKGAPRGFLFWDVWGKTSTGEELIAGGQPLADDVLQGFLDD